MFICESMSGRRHPLDNRNTVSPCRGCERHGQIDWCRAHCSHGKRFYSEEERIMGKTASGVISDDVPREYHEMPLNEAIRLYSARNPLCTMTGMARLFGTTITRVRKHIDKTYIPSRWGQKTRIQ